MLFCFKITLFCLKIIFFWLKIILFWLKIPFLMLPWQRHSFIDQIIQLLKNTHDKGLDWFITQNN